LSYSKTMNVSNSTSESSPEFSLPYNADYLLATVIISACFTVFGTLVQLAALYKVKVSTGLAALAWVIWTIGSTMWIFYGLMLLSNNGDSKFGVAATGIMSTGLNVTVLMIVCYYWCYPNPSAAYLVTDSVEAPANPAPVQMGAATTAVDKKSVAQVKIEPLPPVTRKQQRPFVVSPYAPAVNVGES